MEQKKQRADNRNIELLAPAGNKEAFYGAVHAGADAVYLGGEKFGARAYADNFTREELLECIRYGHIHGCRSYLTVNTLMKELELAELMEALTPLYEAGLDGVIVQDIGALELMRQHFPGLELHASTQMTITGAAGAELLKELGVTRVVPARELSLQELTQLKAQAGLEIEAFIHGAMCYCYSGACLLSSFLGGRSGNRGRCAQPCRLAYEMDSPGASVHKKEYYPLSLKDMCTIEHLPKLIEAGIDSFKIEGRMKKPEYAAGVTAIYRKYIDCCLAHPGKAFSVEKQDLDALSRLYIRSGRQEGYYFKRNGREMVTLDSPSYSGSDEVYLKQLRETYIEKKKRISVWMRAAFVCGEPARLLMGTGKYQVEARGSLVEPARSCPVLEADIRRQLQKLGESCFALESLEVEMDGEGFFSLKELNALRREAVRQLEDQIIAGYGLTARRSRKQEVPAALSGDKAGAALPGNGAGAEAAEAASPGGGELRVHVSTGEQLLYLAEYIRAAGEESLDIRRLYVESHLLSEHGETLDAIAAGGTALWIALPYILRDRDEQIMEEALELYRRGRAQGFLARSLEEYGWLSQRMEDGSREHPCPVQLDHTIYVWNSHAAAFWQKKGCGITCPLELSGREWREVQKQQIPEPFPEKLVYGRVPVMLTANCIAKTAGKCLREQGGRARNTRAQGALTDRYRKQFPVELRCDVCMNVIYNSVPLSLHRQWEQPGGMHRRLSFTVESGEEMGQVLDFFAKCGDGEQRIPPFGDYTTGHERKGVL